MSEEPPREPAFRELLARARQGDREAWNALFERLARDEKEGRILHRMARRLLPPGDRARDHVESLDLLQSALRSGWLDMERFRGETEAEFYAWMRAILRRKLSRVVRKRRPAPGLDTRVAEEAAGAGQETAPIERLVREEMRERLRRAVTELPQTERQVIELRLQGKTSREIGELLGLSPEAVRMREYRAGRKLKEKLRKNPRPTEGGAEGEPADRGGE